MGVLSKLLGRRKAAAARPDDKAHVEETLEDEETPDDEEDDASSFDPDATMFVSVKIPVLGQQAMRKLREYETGHVTHYDWLCGNDCFGECRRVQEEGPYSVADGLAGIAPVPGMGAYRECSCTVVPAKGKGSAES